MNNKRINKNILFLSIFILVSFTALVVAGLMFYSHFKIINSEIDSSDWITSNSEYEIVSDISDGTIGFYIYDNDGKLIQNLQPRWRTFDFKCLVLCENNDIIIYTGDMGEQVFYYNDGSWDLT